MNRVRARAWGALLLAMIAVLSASMACGEAEEGGAACGLVRNIVCGDLCSTAARGDHAVGRPTGHVP